jgi:hypothetical protein
MDRRKLGHYSDFSGDARWRLNRVHISVTVSVVRFIAGGVAT